MNLSALSEPIPTSILNRKSTTTFEVCSSIILAEFHLGKGSSIVAQIPHDIPISPPTLAGLMIPEGSHLRAVDYTVFRVPNTTTYDPNQCAITSDISLPAFRTSTYSAHSSIFHISDSKYTTFQQAELDTTNMSTIFPDTHPTNRTNKEDIVHTHDDNLNAIKSSQTTEYNMSTKSILQTQQPIYSSPLTSLEVSGVNDNICLSIIWTRKDSTSRRGARAAALGLVLKTRSYWSFRPLLLAGLHAIFASPPSAYQNILEKIRHAANTAVVINPMLTRLLPLQSQNIDDIDDIDNNDMSNNNKNNTHNDDNDNDSDNDNTCITQDNKDISISSRLRHNFGTVTQSGYGFDLYNKNANICITHKKDMTNQMNIQNYTPLYLSLQKQVAFWIHAINPSSIPFCSPSRLRFSLNIQDSNNIKSKASEDINNNNNINNNINRKDHDSGMHSEFFSQIIPSPIPSQTSEASISWLLSVFGAQGVILIYNALLQRKRVLFIGFQQSARACSLAVVSACALISASPILRQYYQDKTILPSSFETTQSQTHTNTQTQIQTQTQTDKQMDENRWILPLSNPLYRSFPYASLYNTDFLKDNNNGTSGGYIAGVTNPIFEPKIDWWDLCCNLSKRTVTPSPSYENWTRDLQVKISNSLAVADPDISKEESIYSSTYSPWYFSLDSFLNTTQREPDEDFVDLYDICADETQKYYNLKNQNRSPDQSKVMKKTPKDGEDGEDGEDNEDNENDENNENNERKQTSSKNNRLSQDEDEEVISAYDEEWGNTVEVESRGGVPSTTPTLVSASNQQLNIDDSNSTNNGSGTVNGDGDDNDNDNADLESNELGENNPSNQPTDQIDRNPKNTLDVTNSENTKNNKDDDTKLKTISLDTSTKPLKMTKTDVYSGFSPNGISSQDRRAEANKANAQSFGYINSGAPRQRTKQRVRNKEKQVTPNSGPKKSFLTQGDQELINSLTNLVSSLEMNRVPCRNIDYTSTTNIYGVEHVVPFSGFFAKDLQQQNQQNQLTPIASSFNKFSLLHHANESGVISSIAPHGNVSNLTDSPNNDALSVSNKHLSHNQTNITIGLPTSVSSVYTSPPSIPTPLEYSLRLFFMNCTNTLITLLLGPLPMSSDIQMQIQEKEMLDHDHSPFYLPYDETTRRYIIQTQAHQLAAILSDPTFLAQRQLYWNQLGLGVRSIEKLHFRDEVLREEQENTSNIAIDDIDTNTNTKTGKDTDKNVDKSLQDNTKKDECNENEPRNASDKSTGMTTTKPSSKPTSVTECLKNTHTIDNLLPYGFIQNRYNVPIMMSILRTQTLPLSTFGCFASITTADNTSQPSNNTISNVNTKNTTVVLRDTAPASLHALWSLCTLITHLESKIANVYQNQNNQGDKEEETGEKKSKQQLFEIHEEIESLAYYILGALPAIDGSINTLASGLAIYDKLINSKLRKILQFCVSVPNPAIRALFFSSLNPFWRKKSNSKS